MIRTYKCATCGSDLVYDPVSKGLLCSHCGNKQDILSASEGRDLTIPAEDEAKDQAGNGKLIYNCPNCGAELVTDEHTLATSCSYCNSPMLIESRYTGELKPKEILPFGFDKKQAQQNFKNWKGTGFLTPASFKSAETMEKIRGVYVPYWLYDYTADVTLEGHGANTRVERHGDEEVIITDHFQFHRESQSEYEHVTKEAHATYSENDLSVLEPYDFSALTEFLEPYLAGFYADKYGKTSEELESSVRNAVSQDAVQAAAELIYEYGSTQIQRADVEMSRAESEYAFLPVYMLNYKYGGTNYPLYMNGQTGKIQGELPVSRGKLLLVGLIGFIVVFLITFMLGRGL